MRSSRESGERASNLPPSQGLQIAPDVCFYLGGGLDDAEVALAEDVSLQGQELLQGEGCLGRVCPPGGDIWAVDILAKEHPLPEVAVDGEAPRRMPRDRDDM